MNRSKVDEVWAEGAGVEGLEVLPQLNGGEAKSGSGGLPRGTAVALRFHGTVPSARSPLIETSFKPMTARQRSELEQLVSPLTWAMRTGLFLFVVGLVGLLLRGLQASAAWDTNVPFWTMPTLIFAGFIYFRGGRWTGGPELRRKIRRDLERGELAYHQVRVVDALEAPEVEDEGPVFFLLEEGGETLFFSGQDMARYKSRGFPWTAFEIITSPVAGQFFRLRSLGESFQGVRQRAPLDFSEAKALGVVNASFGKLEKTLQELAELG